MITKKIFIKDLQRKIKIILLSILCLYFFSACQKNENTTVVCNGYYYNQENIKKHKQKTKDLMVSLMIIVLKMEAL